MSEKQRRQRDILNGTYSSYDSATKAYSDYFDGEAPQYVTYYQISDEASKVDTTLNDTHEAIGSNSSLRYNRIKHVPVYKMAAPWDIAVQLNDNGLDSTISGSFIFLPSVNLHPRDGEFFAIEYEADPELQQHLFHIDNVSFDRATNNTKKYFNCEYSLFKEDTDFISSQISGKYIYVAHGNNEGVGDSYMVSEESYTNKSDLKDVVDSMIDRYRDLFYNEGMDTFTYARATDNTGTNFEYYWSPYLCHFLYKNDVVSKYSEDFLSEIYVQDVNESLYPFVYCENGYRGSIFYAVEKKDVTLLDELASSFMQTSTYNLNAPMSLPFFSAAEKYYLVSTPYKPYNFGNVFYPTAFHWLFGKPEETVMNASDSFKFENPMAEHVHLDENNNCICDINLDNAKDNVIYQVAHDNRLNVLDVYHINSNAEIEDAKLSALLDGSTVLSDSGYLLFNIVKEYINGTFSNRISSEIASGQTESNLDTFISTMSNYFFENNFQSYVLMPMVIYIIKTVISA
jgi:hypothetical protein